MTWKPQRRIIEHLERVVETTIDPGAKVFGVRRAAYSANDLLDHVQSGTKLGRGLHRSYSAVLSRQEQARRQMAEERALSRLY